MAKIIEKIPQSLKEALISHDCIPFVGSGLSLSFCIPTWKTLIDSLKHRCDEEKCENSELIKHLAIEGEYLVAAQKAKDKLGKSIFKMTIEDEINSYDKSKELTVQRLLWDLDPPLIMTTNFDTLLEESVARKVNVVTPLHKSKLADLVRSPTDSRILFKVHGCIEEFESLIFTSEDYNKLYGPTMSAYQFTFTTSILKHKLLFLGFSLEDEAIINILTSVKDLFDGFAGNHYALLRKSETKARIFWEKCNVNVIEYEEHCELEQFVKEIAKIVNSSGSIMHKETVGIYKNDNSKGPSRKCHLPPNKVTLPPSKSIPREYPEIRKESIGECVILATSKLGKNSSTWGANDINSSNTVTFFKPKGTLASVNRNMDLTFRKFHYISTPRFSLRSFKIEPKISYRAGDLHLETELTDWTLIHGLQNTMVQDTPETLEINDCFWASMNSLVTENKSLNFPHHLATHCLIISKDNKVVLNKRIGVENQRGRVSASFEEQMQFPFVFPASADKELRYFDGDSTPFDSIIRGAEEELNIKLQHSDIRILALCMESSSVAANFLSIAKSHLTIDQIYEHWTRADDKNENKMIPPDYSPSWNVDQMAALISDVNYMSEDSVYDGVWHASSQTRILLGLIADFGIEKVKEKIDIPEALTRRFT